VLAEAQKKKGFFSRAPRKEAIRRTVELSPPTRKGAFLGGFPMVILILGILTIASCHYTFTGFFNKVGSVSAEKTLKEPGLAVLAIRGEIYDTDWAIQAVQRFQRDSNVKALIIRIDSPGGLVAPCQELYGVLAKFNKPKIVSMGSLAASGGYYIAVTGDVIYANPGTITGSIGVIMETIEFSTAMEKLGIKSEVIKSGKFKDSGSPFRSMRPEERDALQSMVMNVYEQFVRDVMSGRRKMTEPAVRALADGRIFSGEEAQALGLVDRIGGFNEALIYAKQMGGLPRDKEPQIIYEDGEIGLFSQMFKSTLWFLKPVERAITPGLTLKFIYQPGL
jgi:protease-4